MEEQDQTTEPTQIPKPPILCEECKSNPSKYKCPGCLVRSCSLACVKAHKQRLECNGKRHQTQFVHKALFDDNLLISDYNLLEEVKRVADSAERTRVKLCGYHYFKPPFHLRSLKSAASQRRTKLLFLPSGMSKRERNKSRYEQRKKVISWTIEWRFHSTDVVLLDHGVYDNLTLGSIIEKHLKPGPWNHPLRKFCEEKLDCLKFFIRKYPKGARSPFRELDIKAPISQQLANLVILEYPIIHVFLPSHSYDFEVVKDANPHLPKPDYKDDVSSNHPSLKGVPFKEEEIEDGSSEDPLVLDLMKHMKPEGVFQIPREGREERELNNLPDRSSLARVDQEARPVLENDIGVHTSGDDKPAILEDMDFEFDQGLLDAYSDLIAEINPDDFLDLEGGVTKEMESEDHLDFSTLFPVEEELEEGEIPEL